MAVLQIVQRGDQRQPVMRKTPAGFACDYLFDTAVEAFAVVAELQKSGLAEQAFHIEIKAFADQFDLDRIKGTDGFRALESEHFEIVADRRDQQRKTGGRDRGEHALVLLLP